MHDCLGRNVLDNFYNFILVKRNFSYYSYKSVYTHFKIVRKDSIQRSHILHV